MYRNCSRKAANILALWSSFHLQCFKWTLNPWILLQDFVYSFLLQGSIRITESFRPETPLRQSSPAVNPALLSPPLNHVPKHHIYTSLKYLQKWWFNHFLGSLFQGSALQEGNLLYFYMLGKPRSVWTHQMNRLQSQKRCRVFEMKMFLRFYFYTFSYGNK